MDSQNPTLGSFCTWARSPGRLPAPGWAAAQLPCCQRACLLELESCSPHRKKLDPRMNDTPLAPSLLTWPTICLARVFTEAVDPILLLDPGGNILDLNQEAEHIFGWPRQELLGQSLTVLVPAEQQANKLDLLQRCRCGERVRNVESQLRTRDGRCIPVLFTLSLLARENGEPAAMAYLAKDITAQKQVEQALRQSEEQLRLALSVRCIGIWDWNPSSGRITWSASMYRILGLQPGQGEPGYETWLPAVHPEDRQRVEAALRHSKEQRQEFQAEYRVVWPDGSIHWIDARGRYEFDEQGKPVRMYGLLMDIDREKRIEQELRDSEERARALNEASFDTLVLHDQGLILDVNDSFTKMFGVPRAEIIGQGDIARFIAPESLETVLTMIRLSLPGPYEAILQRHEGSRFPAELRASQLRYRGKMVRVVSIRDVSEHKAAERALRETSELYRLALEAGELGTWDSNQLTGTVHWDNRSQRIFGVPAELTLTAAEAEHFIHPDDRAMVQAVLQAACDPGSTGKYEVEERLFWPDGSIHWVAVKGQVFFDGQGPQRQPVRIIGTVQDITQRKATEERLRQLTTSLEQEVAARTAVLEQQAAQLRQLTTELTNAEQRERKRLAALIHDHLQQLLVGAKMRIGLAQRRAVVPTVLEMLTEVSDLLNEAVEAARSLTMQLRPPVLYEDGLAAALRWLSQQMYRQHRLHVELALKAEAEPMADPVKALLFEAVRELLFNVVKYAGVTQAEVGIERTADRRVHLYVADRGQGFEPGRLEQSQSGFGLFSIRERMKALGGHMELQTQPGQGVQVHLYLPREIIDTSLGTAPPQEATTAERADPLNPAQVLPEAACSIQVLIADDHRMVREGLANLLQEVPAIDIIAQAADGEEAVQLARRHRPDVVIMDVNMPRLNGIEATRIIHQELPDIQVIGLSVLDEDGIAESMKAAGAVAYLCKGGDPEELIQAIQQARGLSGR